MLQFFIVYNKFEDSFREKFRVNCPIIGKLTRSRLYLKSFIGVRRYLLVTKCNINEAKFSYPCPEPGEAFKLPRWLTIRRCTPTWSCTATTLLFHPLPSFCPLLPGRILPFRPSLSRFRRHDFSLPHLLPRLQCIHPHRRLQKRLVLHKWENTGRPAAEYPDFG